MAGRVIVAAAAVHLGAAWWKNCSGAATGGATVAPTVQGAGWDPAEGWLFNITSDQWQQINTQTGNIRTRCLTDAQQSNGDECNTFGSYVMRSTAFTDGQGVTTLTYATSTMGTCPPDLSQGVDITPWNYSSPANLYPCPTGNPPALAGYIGGPGNYTLGGGQILGIELTSEEFREYSDPYTVNAHCILRIDTGTTSADGKPYIAVSTGRQTGPTGCYVFVLSDPGVTMEYVPFPDAGNPAQCATNLDPPRSVLDGYFPPVPPASPSPSASGSPSPTGSPSVTASVSPSSSVSPSVAGSPSLSASVSVSPSVTVSPSVSASGGASVSSSASASVSPSATVSTSVSPSTAASPSVSPTAQGPTAPGTPGSTPTATLTATSTPSTGASPSSTGTSAPTITATKTPSLTPGASPSHTSTVTATPSQLPPPPPAVLGALLRIPIIIPGVTITDIRGNTQFQSSVQTDVARALGVNASQVAVDDRAMRLGAAGGVNVTVLVTFPVTAAGSSQADIDAALATAQATANATWYNNQAAFATPTATANSLLDTRNYIAFVLHVAASDVQPYVQTAAVNVSPTLPTPPAPEPSAPLAPGIKAAIAVPIVVVLLAVLVGTPFAYCKYKSMQRQRNMMRGVGVRKQTVVGNPLQKPSVSVEMKAGRASIASPSPAASASASSPRDSATPSAAESTNTASAAKDDAFAPAPTQVSSRRNRISAAAGVSTGPAGFMPGV